MKKPCPDDSTQFIRRPSPLGCGHVGFPTASLPVATGMPIGTRSTKGPKNF